MTKTLSINEISIQTVIKYAKSGDEIVLEEDGKPIAKIMPIEKPKELKQRVFGLGKGKTWMSEDFEYQREGVVDLYLACEPLQGKREIFVRENHNRLNWAEVIRYIAEEMYPQANKITIVEDNLSAHKPSTLYEIMSPEKARNILRRIEFVHTPKHGSWLNIAEIELSLLKRLGIAKRVGTQIELEKQIENYQNKRAYQASKSKLAIHNQRCKSEIETALSVNRILTEH